MKQVLFVINTLGCAGAETAMIEMIRNMDPEKYKISVFVLLNQGEMIYRLPESVTVLNEHFSDSSVLSKEGKKELNRYIFSQLFHRGTIWKKIPYIFRGLVPMIRSKRILPDKLLWRVMAEAAPRFDTHYDMAVAYLEGGSTYYVADYVSADVKVGFVHIDYEKAGYTRQLDGGCYDLFDRICPVSDEVKEHFLAVYPQYEKKTKVFHNMIDTDKIRKGAEKPGGFDDDFAGVRLLTVGRLTAQKAYEVAVDAMKLLKERGRNVRWYILGEGEERKALEKKIKEYGLEQDFLLLGAKENPILIISSATFMCMQPGLRERVLRFRRHRRLVVRSLLRTAREIGNRSRMVWMEKCVRSVPKESATRCVNCWMIKKLVQLTERWHRRKNYPKRYS